MGCLSYFGHFGKLGLSKAIVCRGMSQLIFALLEVWSLKSHSGPRDVSANFCILQIGLFLDPDFPWDVSATFGTFAKQVYVRSLVSLFCYFLHFWKLDPSWFLTFRGMSQLVLALL